MPKGDNAGRPQGSYILDEPKTETIEISLTPTAREWLKSKKRGWLGQLVEHMARGYIQIPTIEVVEPVKAEPEPAEEENYCRDCGETVTLDENDGEYYGCTCGKH